MQFRGDASGKYFGWRWLGYYYIWDYHVSGCNNKQQLRGEDLVYIMALMQFDYLSYDGLRKLIESLFN